MSISSAEIKRQILISAKDSPIKRKMAANPQGVKDGEYIEMGNDLEAITKMRGWALIETYMLRQMNLVGLVLSKEADPDQKGAAKGFIELMQWIHIIISKRDELLEQERMKYETKNVQKNEA